MLVVAVRVMVLAIIGILVLLVVFNPPPQG